MILAPAQFVRPNVGPHWEGHGEFAPGPGWQSQGGPSARHPARALPSTFVARAPESSSQVREVRMYGVFALWGGLDQGLARAPGAVVELLSENEAVVRKALYAGEHYTDATDLRPLRISSGNGLQLETIGQVRVDGAAHRLDVLTIEATPGSQIDSVRFSDLGTPASFVVFEVAFGYEAPAACPFRGLGQQISLADLATIVRVGDRAAFDRALVQLEIGVTAASEDLDEARSVALLFLAVVSAGLIERGAKRELHRLQLNAARRFEQLGEPEAIARAATEMARQALEATLGGGASETSVRDALAYLDRHFAERVTDRRLAQIAGLSPSHFRHLFRRATGQAVHAYVVALRLERGRQMLLHQEWTVAEVARRVGFASAAHFTRAFGRRFGAAPSSVRATRL